MKDTYEVDFYTGEVLYQVAYEISNEKTRKRELRSFEYFPQSENKPCKLVTYESNEKADGVEIVSFGEFMT